MNKRSVLCMLAMLVVISLFSQEMTKATAPPYPLSKFGVSLNPSGVVFFGPIVNGEIGLGDHFRMITHVRFPSMGFIYRLFKSSSNEETGLVPGGGINYFFGEKPHKLYVGMHAEYHHVDVYYPEGGGSLPRESIENQQVPEKIYPVKRFSLSVNPAGLMSFGPMFHAEVGLGDHLRLDAHVRLPELGVGYLLINSPDQLSAIPSPGAGLIYFFRQGHARPYLGIFAEYDQRELTSWEPNAGPKITKTYKGLVLGFGAGYRFRFSNGFFMGTGAYVFYSKGRSASTNSWTEIVSSGPYKLKRPRVQLDFRLGYEFGL